jgi:ABC-2 type transport system ATP-binding protein
MTPFLELRGLTKLFPGFSLGPLATTFMAGRVHGLLGPNGAGKTTLLNLLALQTRPTRGEILCRGNRVRWGDPGWKARMAYVREVPAFYAELTVAETLRLSARLYERWDAALASGMAARLGLDEDQRVGTLSKGTLVKLGIVSALGHRAELLVLDEPTAGVDPSARQELHGVLAELRCSRPDLCVLLSSHIFEDLETSADDVLILRGGKIAFRSSREELRALSLYRLPAPVYLPPCDDLKLTWLADGQIGALTQSGSALALRLRAMPGCAEEGRGGLLQAVYHGTNHIVAGQ